VASLILGPDPEMLDSDFKRKGSPPLSKSSDTKSSALPNGHAITENDEKTQDSASCELWNILVLLGYFSWHNLVAQTSSPEGDSSVATAKAVTPDNTSQHRDAVATNSTSEDTDDNIPLPMGGHEDNPSDSGTTSDDEDESNTTEVMYLYGYIYKYKLHF